MKEQKNANKIIYIILAIIIIAGAIVIGIKGFKIELMYSSRQEIILANNLELDAKKVEEIAKSVLENKAVKIKKVERFSNSLEIISKEITEEEKENIINKVNEEYSSDISKDEVDIISVPNTRIRDILKQYLVPSIITYVVILLYFGIMYHKIGLKKVILKGALIPIIAELTYYSIIGITRIPFGRIVNSIAIGVYVISIGILTISFQKEKEKLPKNDKKEND